MLNMARLCFLVAGIFLTGRSLAAVGTESSLVTAGWLETNRKNTVLVLLDASPSHIYKHKHIPGAIHFDIFTYGVHELPVAEIERRFQSWGISRDRKIVVYDQGGTFLATRLFFFLEQYGFPAEDIFVLNGGLSKWQEAGLPVTSEPAQLPNNGSFTITKINEEVRCDLPEFLGAAGDTRGNVLLDALDPGWHFGGTQFFSKPGHIPHSIMLPAADFFNTDKTFKSASEIEKMLTYFGISPKQHIYSHCGGGIAASVPYFALKFLLDYPHVKLYPGSQLEWIADERDLPFWTYAAPYLMREASWLQSWGGKMFRMYGISKVSIVDVRPVEAFQKSHVPFAINVPADVFRTNINTPRTLGETLGRAGVNASFEALVFSGAGLTKDAALAFVLLEKLGHKKISVFTDSMEKWAARGFPVEKDTATGSEKKAQDASAASGAYTVHLQNGILITDVKSTSGVYPKVLIASGKDVPAKAPDGKLVHVPYTDLLNPDGTPKAAKDIWDILSKAGVPRYAELVCFSKDPGEAAVNYFVLKLMGYPDVKVLVK
ncbi:MAG: hypothetical protein KF749_03005 [Bacteroidetes bacterium]|nr:hypothetical protein [Bacteroidota bacterium]MCW5896785.1 hypothetical protein [Bacteroidota bacterium]